MASFFQTFVRIAHKDADTLISEATISAAKDYASFARSNNRGDLEAGIKELKKSGQDKAYSEAFIVAVRSGNLVTGFLGAHVGKYSAQTDDVRLPFESAIDRFTEAFKQSLIDSGLFVNPTPKTTEEKAKAKEAKETKAKEAKDAMITAMVQSGELVRAVDVKKLEDMGVLPLTDALKALGVDVDALQASLTAVSAERDALQASLTAVSAERDALQASLTAVSAKTRKVSA